VRHVPTGIVVTCSETRSQLRNKRIALERLRAILVRRNTPRTPRKATRKSRSVRKRELEAKRRRGMIKKLRQRPRGED
jgi:ribosome-associated protein